MSKRVQKVWNAVTTVLVILVVILALLLVGVRLVGLRPMCVLSGSMEPTYHTGSLIYVKPCAPEDVQVGDAITFVLNEDLDVVTHRVISIDAENEHFYTQGDANDAPDGAPVYFKNLIGRPVFTIPYLGYVSHWVSNPPGMYLAIALALVLIILTGQQYPGILPARPAEIPRPEPCREARPAHQPAFGQQQLGFLDAAARSAAPGDDHHVTAGHSGIVPPHAWIRKPHIQFL